MSKPIFLAVLLILFSAVHLSAEPIYDAPWWRGEDCGIYMNWSFPTDDNPASPDESINANGAAAQIAVGEFGVGWRAELYGCERYGLWDLGREGTMTIQLPELEDGEIYGRIHIGTIFLRDMHRDPAVDVEAAQIITEPKMLKVEFDELGSSWIYSYSQWYAGSSSASIILTANYWNSLIDALEIDVRVLPAFKMPGDSTFDCMVDLRDLVYVRNRLGLDADAGDNWRADVNRDGAIDNADLIYVRNRLGTACGDENGD